MLFWFRISYERPYNVGIFFSEELKDQSIHGYYEKREMNTLLGQLSCISLNDESWSKLRCISERGPPQKQFHLKALIFQ